MLTLRRPATAVTAAAGQLSQFLYVAAIVHNRVGLTSITAAPRTASWVAVLVRSCFSRALIGDPLVRVPATAGTNALPGRMPF